MDQGAQTAQGMSFRSFQAMNSFATGETLAINLRGAPGAPGAALDTGNLAPLLIGVGAFGAVLAGAGFWLYRQRKSQAEEEELADGEEGAAVEVESEEDSETIIDAIVALDDRHAAGELPEAAYRQRRAELKARLAEALAREDRAARGKDE